MTRRARLIAFVAALLVLAGTFGVESSLASGDLNVYFTQTGGIRVALGDGTSVGTPDPPGTSIPPGDYRVTVYNDFRDDLGFTHQFRLSGPGVNLVTDMNQGEEDTASWSYTFQPNATYTWVDMYQPDALHGVFRTSTAAPAGAVGSSGTASGGASASGPSGAKQPVSTASNSDVIGSKVVPVRGRLTGTVSTSGKLTLTYRGKRVSSLRSGRYRIDVRDETGRSGFKLRRLRTKEIALTSVAFVGKRSRTVVLKAGQWMFYSSAAKKSYFVVVN